MKLHLFGLELHLQRRPRPARFIASRRAAAAQRRVPPSVIAAGVDDPSIAPLTRAELARCYPYLERAADDGRLIVRPSANGRMTRRGLRRLAQLTTGRSPQLRN